MRSFALNLLILLTVIPTAFLAAACEDGPPQGPAVESGFSGDYTQYVDRDDFSAMGHYLDYDGRITDSIEPLILRDEASWAAELSYLYHSGKARSFAFGLHSLSPAVPLAVGVEHDLQLVLTDPTWPAGQSEVLTTTKVQLHPDTLLVPVVVWNPGGAVAGLDEAMSRLMLNRGPTTPFPEGLSLTSWARQRVDEVWAACNIQFRMVRYSEQWLDGGCWGKPPISNQDPFFQKCVTNRPACTAGDPVVQDFTDCAQQEVNRCTLRELLDWTMETPSYVGPALYEPDVVNVYLLSGFHLWENMTAGIGCRGDVPFVALSDVFPDGSGLRLAHEMGHIMGILEHTPDTVMGDTGQRTTAVTPALCDEARAYVVDRYPWVR